MTSVKGENGQRPGRPCDRQGAGRRWGPGAQPPGRLRTCGAIAEHGLAGRATAREPDGDGVRGRSPRRWTQASVRRQSTGSRPAASSAAFARENGRLPKKPLCGRQRRGVGRLDDDVAAPVDERASSAGARAPQDEHDPLRLVVHRLDDRVGERLPALALVRGRLRARTVSVALSSSTPWLAQGSRLPWRGAGQPRSLSSSLKMFTSDGGGGTPGLHREAQAVRLARPVVGVLAQDQHLHLGVRREVRGPRRRPRAAGNTGWRARSSATKACSDRQ